MIPGKDENIHRKTISIWLNLNIFAHIYILATISLHAAIAHKWFSQIGYNPHAMLCRVLLKIIPSSLGFLYCVW